MAKNKRMSWLSLDGRRANSMNLDATVEILAAESAEGEAPKRPTFTINAYSGGAIKVGFGRPIVIDLDGLRHKSAVPILLDHKSEQIVGQANEIAISRAGVKLAGVITGDDDHAQKVVSHAKNGFQWAASVGVGIDRVEYVDAGSDASVNGKKVRGPVAIVRSGRLGEVSFVAIGADETAGAQIAASAGKDDNMTFSEWLKARGFDEADLSEKQIKAMRKDFEASADRDDDDEPVAPAREPARPKIRQPGETGALSRMKAERARQDAINASAERVLATNPAELDTIELHLQAALEDTSMTEKDFELACYRDMKAAKPVDPVNRDKMPEDKVIEAALCLAAGIGDVEKDYKPEVLEAANKRFRHGLGLGETLLMFAKRNGVEAHSFRSNSREILQAAFNGNRQMNIRAGGGFSTNSISNVLSNVANKSAERGFRSVEGSWAEICSIKSVRDFKTNTGVALGGDLTYQKVGPGGEITHGTLGEHTYSIKAETFGRMMAITYQDIVNDDLSVLSEVPFRLGRGGMLAINREFWTSFNDNSSFFTTGTGSKDTGTDTALSLGAMELAEALFLAQTDPDGNPVGLMPSILLVPAALTNRARIITSSAEARTIMDDDESSAVGRYGTTNPYAGRFRVVGSAHMQSTALGGTTAAWYLLADPNDMATIEVAFLNGQQAPVVESADADFDTLGIKMRGVHFFGVAKKEYRAGVMMAGA